MIHPPKPLAALSTDNPVSDWMQPALLNSNPYRAPLYHITVPLSCEQDSWATLIIDIIIDADRLLSGMIDSSTTLFAALGLWALYTMNLCNNWPENIRSCFSTDKHSLKSRDK